MAYILWALAPLTLGLMATRRRRAPRIRLRIYGCLHDWEYSPHRVQFLRMSITDRNGVQLAVGMLLSDEGTHYRSEYANRILAARKFAEIRDGWRDHVLPDGWRDRRAARLQRLARNAVG